MQDKDIVQMYFDRDEQAIAETAAKYGRFCTNIALNILGNPEDAEECVNDAYLKTWESIPPHRPNVLSAFLGRIVRNLSLNLFKQRHALKRGGNEITLILDELGDIVSDEEAVIDAAIKHELISTVNSFISTLSEEKQYMFFRRYWYSDSVKAIAAECGRTENYVSVELGRIRKKLRKYLTERGYDL